MKKHLKTFISYSHDSQEHKRTVLAFANQLREQGINCNLDQYEESPEVGWIAWMEDEIANSAYVLVICTRGYAEKFNDRTAERGRGVKWEGAIITQELYESAGRNRKFIPVLLNEDDNAYIPRALKPFTHYNALTRAGYERLYRRLTKQPAIKKPPIGKIIKFPGKANRIFSSTDTPELIDRAISQSITGNNNVQIGVLRGDIRIPHRAKTAITMLPSPGTIGANQLLKQAIKDRFDKLGEEREKRFGKSAYGAMYKIFKDDFGIKKKPWTIIWTWPEAAAKEIIRYLDEKDANTIKGRIEGAVRKGSSLPSKGHLYKREKELLAQLDLEISSPEVKASMERYFGVDSHTKLDLLKHWHWVMYLEKTVRETIGE